MCCEAIKRSVLEVTKPSGANGKEPACQCRRLKGSEFDPWVGKIPWRRAWQPTPVFLSGESHGQRSLAGCGPWGHKKSRTWLKWLSRKPSEDELCPCMEIRVLRRVRETWIKVERWDRKKRQERECSRSTTRSQARDTSLERCRPRAGSKEEMGPTAEAVGWQEVVTWWSY